MPTSDICMIIAYTRIFVVLIGVVTILESEAIETAWPANDSIALTRKICRGVGAQPPSFNRQNVNL